MSGKTEVDPTKEVAKELINRKSKPMSINDLKIMAVTDASSFRDEDWKQIAFIMAFEGFDPENVLRVIVQKGISIEMIKAIIVWGASRGFVISTTSKAFKKSSAGAQALLTQFANILTSTNTALGKDDLTVSRVFAAFPLIAGKAMLFYGRQVVDEKDVPLGCPGYLRFTAGASLIPSNQSALLAAFREWAYAYDMVINGKLYKTDNKIDETKKTERRAVVDKFIEISHKSKYVSDNARSSALSTLDTASKGFKEAKYGKLASEFNEDSD